MSIKVLISTMHEPEPIELLKRMNVSSDSVIINQCGKDKSKVMNFNEYPAKYICSSKTGLSRSRNEALLNMGESGIGLLADDDLIYVDKYTEIISQAFEDNPDYDIIAFQVEGINGSFKSYNEINSEIKYIKSLKISSVEIAFRIEKIKGANLKFREEFGSGSIFKMGEENIFLYDCLRKGLRIKYLPIKIANLYIGDSTWFDGFNSKYFFDKGAVYTAMTRKWAVFLILQFALRHFKTYRKEIKFPSAIKFMMRGRREYLRNYLGSD